MKALLVSLLLLVPAAAEAYTVTKVFSGDTPHKVYQYAQQAGYEYPTEEIRCSQRCRQRWAKDHD